MAKRGSTKALSITHEEEIARLYGGKRSKSSGASVTDAGDVKTGHDLFECKMTGSPGKLCEEHSIQDCSVCMRVPTLVQVMEKVADEAWEMSKDPVVALRYYVPFSILANPHGWVDLTVRLTTDDAMRT